MYRESHILDEISEDRSRIARYRNIFDQLWEAAFDNAASIHLVAERAARMTHRLKRR